jgi:D-alanyl-D-alanine carboxypeptidase/D-alanyl-D-alanine-endopeptidase (penicillin-binding protein 4)
MHAFVRAVASLCLAFFMAQAGAEGALPTPVSRALERAGLPRQALGVVVRELGARQSLLELQAEQEFAPASLMKLVTTAAALDLLGPAYTWRTQVLTTGALHGDVLEGDLVLRGGGDPRLTIEHLWLMLRQLRQRGVREIRGKLLLDRSAFEQVAADPAAFDGDPDRPYNAVPDALLLNYRALTLRFLPDAQAGLVRVGVEPALANWSVAAPLLAAGDCQEWRANLQMRPGTRGLAFDGAYPLSCGERSLALHAWQLDPDLYFGAVFTRLWNELGGSFRGQVQSAVTPETAQPLLEWRSPPLSEIIRDINKYSNNVMARHLLMTLGAERQGWPGNVQKGGMTVQAWMAEKEIGLQGLTLENGSGLSRNERIAPATLARLLAWTWQSPLMPEFVASLPLVGLDGTMRNRLRNAAGMAHIKTGSLADVRGIAGYVQAASGKRYVVVAIVNHPNAGAAAPALDSLLQWVVEKG